MEWIPKKKKKVEICSRNDNEIQPSIAVKDPKSIRTKRCGQVSLSHTRRTKRVVYCNKCKGEGHNRRICWKDRKSKGKYDENDYDDERFDGDEGDELKNDTQVSTSFINVSIV